MTMFKKEHGFLLQKRRIEKVETKEIQNVLSEIPDERNICPCMTMVRLVAESIAEDLNFISKRTVGEEL